MKLGQIAIIRGAVGGQKQYLADVTLRYPFQVDEVGDSAISNGETSGVNHTNGEITGSI